MPTVGYIGSISSSMLQSILDMRVKLDDLQRQLGTGQKSTDYAGLGLDRGISLSLRGQLSALSSYDTSINTAGVRLNLAQSVLGNIDGIAHTVKNSAVTSTYSIDQTGQTSQQKSAFSQLDQLLGMLNTQAGDRYLFSGKSVDQPSVQSASLVLNGDGVHAGLKQIIAERLQADLGANGLGRLNIGTPTGTKTTLTEDAGVFGLKLAAINSTLANATLTGPAGAPAAASVDFTGVPAAGQQVTFVFTLPDGSTQNLTMTATASASPAANEFTIGANAGATATNFRTALAASLTTLAGTSLTAASAVAAADNFFDTAGGQAPQRVSGTPATATALVDGTAANTVIWYTGDNGSDPARDTADAQIDPAIKVSYGLRANEQAIRLAVQNIAVFAAATFSTSNPNGEAAYAALTKRVGANLESVPGQQKISDIQSEIASAQTAFDNAKARHQQTSNVLTDLLQNIEGVSQEQVGAQILSLQTSLQASLQTTALLSKISLVNYLPM